MYYASYYKDGKRIETPIGRQYKDGMTPARASLIRGELLEGKRLTNKEKREKAAAEAEADRGRWTIGRIFETYQERRPEGHSKSCDRSRYNTYLKRPFGKVEPQDLMPLDVDRFRINRCKMRSPQTVKHALSLLTRIVNYGVDMGLSQPCPFRIKKPKVNNTVTEDLTPRQLKRLVKAPDDAENQKHANIMRMALFTGMRRGEIFSLKWDHIDFERGFIRIVDPKGGVNQIIPLNDDARAVLESAPREEGDEYVFPSRLGGRLTAIKPTDILKAAGLPKGFRPLHGLRHVFASTLASSSQVDLYQLQRLPTHKSPTVTQRYAHLRDEALRKSSNLMGSLVKDTIANVSDDKVARL
jgi:integrase